MIYDNEIFHVVIMLQNLDQSKLTTELSLEEKGVWLDVAIECLTLRECRRDIDVVKDYVEDELHKVN